MHQNLYLYINLYRAICRVSKATAHYDNLPMQYTEIFLALKLENFQLKNFDSFLIFSQNIDCGHTLEPPRRGGSNEYPHYVLEQNKKKMFTPAYPSFAI